MSAAARGRRTVAAAVGGLLETVSRVHLQHHSTQCQLLLQVAVAAVQHPQPVVPG